MDILGKLTEERKARKISQLRLAKKIGVSQTSINHWENGVKDIPFMQLLRYAKAMGGRIVFIKEDIIEDMFF